MKSFVALCGVSEAPPQTKNFLSISFPLRGGGVGGGGARKMQVNFWVCPRELASAARRATARVERTLRVQATTHAERAKSVGVLFEMGSNFLIQ